MSKTYEYSTFIVNAVYDTIRDNFPGIYTNDFCNRIHQVIVKNEQDNIISKIKARFCCNDLIEDIFVEKTSFGDLGTLVIVGSEDFHEIERTIKSIKCTVKDYYEASTIRIVNDRGIIKRHIKDIPKLFDESYSKFVFDIAKIDLTSIDTIIRMGVCIYFKKEVEIEQAMREALNKYIDVYSCDFYDVILSKDLVFNKFVITYINMYYDLYLKKIFVNYDEIYSKFKLKFDFEYIKEYIKIVRECTTVLKDLI